MEWRARWIKPKEELGEVCPVFLKEFKVSEDVKEAKLIITAMGVYEAELNGTRVSSYVLAPGFTTYKKRLQYQEYDISNMLKQGEQNKILVTVGKGWYRSRMPGWADESLITEIKMIPAGLKAQIEIIYKNDNTECISTDESWTSAESPVRFSEIYDGEIYDATYQSADFQAVLTFDGPDNTLIPQEGEEIREQENLYPSRIFTTPNNETIIDFGQNLTGYVEVNLSAKKGDVIELSFAEVLDKEGNFYTENYRGAKSLYKYICKEGEQTYKTKTTFYGFRYVRIDSFPNGAQTAKSDNFKAIALHSEMVRTGQIKTSNHLLNKLISNVIWGQKGNFLDVPTDCPQRDERLGWTGDAQVFIKAACLNYNVEKFFTKWLADLSADQREDGYVGHVIPDILGNENASAAWGDAACICPYELYLAYGNKDILIRQFESMKSWIAYITNYTKDKYLWTGGVHYGDWLGLDAESGSYEGSSRKDFIASAFYAYSTSLVIKAGKIIGKDISEYEDLYNNIVKAFRIKFPEYLTQTECVLAIHFNLAPDVKAAAEQLAEMVQKVGIKLQTGFVGTPYLLHALSDYGYTELAYSLLLRTEYPSWLYPVTKGATTIWEHWDGIMENGDFWSKDMNSYNHYAYGAVADWIYTVAAGIKYVEEYPGYEKVKIAPVTDERLDWIVAAIDTKYGRIRSEWKKVDDSWRYEIDTPVDAEIIIENKSYKVSRGSYVF